MKILISPDKKQYKANLHSHSTISDGKLTPEEMKEAYKSHGYSVLAITDHEVPKSHSDMSEDGFVMITGYECYIRPEGSRYNPYNPEVHLCLYARDPENEKFVCCDPSYCHYIKGEGALESYEKVGSTRPREYTVEYVNEYIKTARENGYILSYNHPYWSFEDEERIFAYDGWFSMEICNYSSYHANRLEYNAGLYDRLLRSGKKVFCHSSDDNHNKTADSFGGFAMILSDSLDYDSIYTAMETGEMYSSMGPMIHSLTVEDGVVKVKCSPAKRVILFTGSKSPKNMRAEDGEYLTEAEFKLDERYMYIRVSVVDENGNAADSRGYMRDEVEAE